MLKTSVREESDCSVGSVSAVAKACRTASSGTTVATAVSVQKPLALNGACVLDECDGGSGKANRALADGLGARQLYVLAGGRKLQQDREHTSGQEGLIARSTSPVLEFD